jgi:DNA polymerase-3 subunit beta
MTTYAQPNEPTTSTASGAQGEETPALKLTCKQEDFAHALSIVKNAVLERSTVPILSGILVATDGGRLRVSATSLEIGIQVWIDAQIEHEGTTVLPATLLTRMVSLLPQGALNLTIPSGSQTLNLTCEGSNTNIRGVDPREFPVIPGIERNVETPIALDAGLLKAMIGQVAFAAENDVSKAVMSSILMSFDDGRLIFAAANTVRLAERRAPLPGVTVTHPVLIPARNLTELARVLPSQGQVKVVVVGEQRNQVVFHLEQGERIDFVTRVVEGNYPNYKNILPKEHATRVVVTTKEFAAALERASLYAVDKMKSVRLTIRGAGTNGNLFGTLTIEADNDDLGNHVSAIQAEVTGPVLEQVIYFNVEYLSQHLSHIDSPQVALEVNAQGRPALLKPVSDTDYTSMVQTMHFKDQPAAAR